MVTLVLMLGISPAMNRLVIIGCSLSLLFTLSACKDDDPETGETQTTGGDTGDDDAGMDTEEPDVPVTLGPQKALCAECKTDSDCGTGGVCVEDARGETFCSRPCGYFGETACPADYYCKQFGQTISEFYCWPFVGVCKADGLDCSPCTADSECGADHFCTPASLGAIQFCARTCSGDGDCSFPNMECAHAEGLTGSICQPVVDGRPSLKCGARPLEFCEPCRTNGSCRSGVCFESENVGSFCSEACDSEDDCRPGTDCVGTGMCQPPLANGCQGFLSCFGVNCGPGEVCHRGNCIQAP